MSAIDPAALFDFAVARSEFIDAHTTVDMAVRSRLAELKATAEPLLGANLEKLAKVSAGPQYAKAEKARVDALVAEMKPYQSLRCDLVHSRMQVVRIDDVAFGLFPNIQAQQGLGFVARLIALEELRTCTGRVRDIARAWQRRARRRHRVTPLRRKPSSSPLPKLRPARGR